MVHEGEEVFCLLPGDPSHSACSNKVTSVLIELVAMVWRTPLIWMITQISSRNDTVSTSISVLGRKLWVAKIKDHNICSQSKLWHELLEALLGGKKIKCFNLF